MGSEPNKDWALNFRKPEIGNEFFSVKFTDEYYLNEPDLLCCCSGTTKG